MIKEQYFHINRSFLVWKIFRPAATPVIRHAHAFSCWIDVVRNLFNNHVIKQPSGLQMVSNALAKYYKSEIVFSRCAWIFFFFSSKGELTLASANCVFIFQHLIYVIDL